ncbi:MAG: DUF427 domain-containing protein, partial [Acidimicrobiia bacterium]|nr:DUF427 domain-containing protein [Acidimicrobiia bacterium]
MRRPSPLPAGPGQESVWDYPRPAVLEEWPGVLRVELGGLVVAETGHGFRVLETSHPPSYYLPPGDCDERLFTRASGRSFCEWKGQAHYWTVTVGEHVVEGGVWSYPQPSPSFASL